MAIPPTRQESVFNSSAFQTALYKTSKENIQKDFLERKQAFSEVAILTDSLTGASLKQIKRLIDNIESRGFDVGYESGPLALLPYTLIYSESFFLKPTKLSLIVQVLAGVNNSALKDGACN